MDKKYLKELKRMKKHLNDTVYGILEENEHGEIELPPVTIIFNGKKIKVDMCAEVFNALELLLDSEIKDHEEF